MAHPPHVSSRGGTAKGLFALARLTLLYQLSKIPGLLHRCQPPCPPDLVLTPQLTSWLLYIYFLSTSPPHQPRLRRLTPCLLSAFPKSSSGSPAARALPLSCGHLPKNAGLKCVLPRKPCLHPPPEISPAAISPPRPLSRGEGPAPLSSPAMKTLSQPLKHLAAASLSAPRAKPRPSREME